MKPAFVLGQSLGVPNLISYAKWPWIRIERNPASHYEERKVNMVHKYIDVTVVIPVESTSIRIQKQTFRYLSHALYVEQWRVHHHYLAYIRSRTWTPWTVDTFHFDQERAFFLNSIKNICPPPTKHVGR